MNSNERMREALEEADTVLSALGYDEKSPIRALIKSSLALPRRNCDVGTAEEQKERFRKACAQYGMCFKCPYHDEDDTFSMWCFLHWAQMPYESEATK